MNALVRVFRGQFACYGKKAYHAGALKGVGQVAHRMVSTAFQTLLDRLSPQVWAVKAKRLCGGPEQILASLGCQPHRRAIANDRLVKWEQGQVRFRWRDYRDGKTITLMRLDAVALIRRLRWPILPSGVFKIRYYGLLSSGNRQTKLKRGQAI